MGFRNCCVVDCKNTEKNNLKVKFYKFPVAWYRREQRRLWINAVKRQDSHGMKWQPTKKDNICSAHFVGGSMSENQYSPSYVPSIFPDIYNKKKINETTLIKRHERFMQRRIKETDITKSNICQIKDTASAENNVIDTTCSATNDNDMDFCDEVSKFKSEECQVNFLTMATESSKTFICNRYIMNNICEAEIQCEINEVDKLVIIPSRKTVSDKKCGTTQQSVTDKCVGPDCNYDFKGKEGFVGISSIESDDQLIDLAGVTFNTFKLFSTKLVIPIQNCKISKENRLLIFFIKMKTGLSYSALSVIFQVHRTTISKIFIETLQHLASILRTSIKWFDKDTVQAMIPDCFKPKYSNTRIIIDCTEFPIEVPAGIDNRIYTYSHYKKGFTAKVLIGCTPNGLITFKSKCAGGRKSDSQITIESGLLDLLENDDVILADKGFPEIRTKINENGKKILVVMPPFLTNPEFSEEEIKDTYSVANVRIHIERIMQRIKLFNILNKVPTNLFPYIDDIVHMCCVLVNLQSSIIAEKTNF